MHTTVQDRRGIRQVAGLKKQDISISHVLERGQKSYNRIWHYPRRDRPIVWQVCQITIHVCQVQTPQRDLRPCPICPHTLSLSPVYHGGKTKKKHDENDPQRPLLDHHSHGACYSRYLIFSTLQVACSVRRVRKRHLAALCWFVYDRRNVL